MKSSENSVDDSNRYFFLIKGCYFPYLLDCRFAGRTMNGISEIVRRVRIRMELCREKVWKSLFCLECFVIWCRRLQNWIEIVDEYIYDFLHEVVTWWGIWKVLLKNKFLLFLFLVSKQENRKFYSYKVKPCL